MEKEDIIELYVDIVNGFSPLVVDNNALFIKHFSSFEDGFISKIYKQKYNDAVKKGLLNNKDKLAVLFDKKIWGDAEELELTQAEFYLSSLKKSKSSAFIPSQIKSINEQIVEAELNVNIVLSKKDGFVGLTAEKYANQQSNNYYIYYSLFKDKETTVPAFSLGEFNDLDNKRLNNIIDYFNRKIRQFEESNLKRVALSSQFQNPYSLCNSAYEFLGKPLSRVSYYQNSLISYGHFYRSILRESEHTPPEDVANDPFKLEDWYNGLQNTEKLMNKYADKEGNVGIFGATQQDIIDMGLQNEAAPSDIFEQLGQKGTLSFKEMLALEGAI